MADSDIEMASGLHSLRTCHFSLKSLSTPFNTFIYLFKNEISRKRVFVKKRYLLDTSIRKK